MCESDTSSSDNDSGSNDNGGSNTVVQNIANALTPNDGKEYVNGELVTPTSFADQVLADTDSFIAPTVNTSAPVVSNNDDNNNNQQFVDTYNQQSVNAEIFPTAASTASGSMQTPSSQAAAREGNTFVQNIANAITPFDDKQYVNGQLIDTNTGAQTNSFVQNVANSITPNDKTSYVGGELLNEYQGPNIDGSSGYGINSDGNAVTLNNDLITDAGQTITSPGGNQTTLTDQKNNFTDDSYNTDLPGLIQTVEQDGTFVRDPNQQTNTVTQNTDSGPTQAEIDAAAEKAAEEERQRLAALRQSAIDGAMGRLADAFGFATDDYFTGLGTEYEEGGLSPAFTTAYDDAVRGMYDVYKSAGLLNQADVDDDLNFLSSSQGSEQDRLDNIVSNYVTANREYVDSGRNTIADQIRALGTVEEINNFDVVSAAQPYRQPTEQSVVDFFTDFAKRSYDPSYNVDPSAVSSGGPRRVSGSVDQLGTNTQPSTVAGIFDPLAGSSARVVA